MNDYVNKLSSMIECNTINEHNDESKQRFVNFQNVLKELFPHVFESFKLELFNGSILLSYIVDNDIDPILLMSHQDVVPENGIWDKGSPFKPEVIDGKLYGRGTLDTKGNLFAIFQSIEELLADGYTFKRSIYIESSCNEETSQEGAKEIVKELKNRNVRFAFVLDEGGFVSNNPFNPNENVALVALGEKATVEAKFIYKSNGGHASTPSNNTPLIVLSKFMQEANKLKGLKVDLADTTLEMVRSISNSTKGIKKFIFKHSKAFKWLLIPIFKRFSPMTKAMTSTTICFTRIEGSNANNVIPETCYVVASIRVSHAEGVASLKSKIEKLAAKYNITIEYLDEGYESAITNYKTPEFAYLKKCVKDIYNVETVPFIANGASDSKYMNEVCDNVFRFAPFVVSDEQIDTVHSPNENVDVDAIAPAVEFFKNLIRGIS